MLNRSEFIIVVILRVLGVGGVLAIPAILMPFSWMAGIHEAMGLGEMPDAPIVHYLARALSAFYAVLGVLALFVSFDLRRFRDYIKLWGGLVFVMGVVMLGIDIEAGMPLGWTLSEGPPTMALGAAVMWLQKGIQAESESS